MKVGIVGASGYSGEVLVKLLLGHPRVDARGRDLAHARGQAAGAGHSRRARYRPRSDVHRLRSGRARRERHRSVLPRAAARRRRRLTPRRSSPPANASSTSAPTSASPISRPTQNITASTTRPSCCRSARFVLPELTPPAWKTEAKLVAAPGCYPTSILVPLVPLLQGRHRHARAHRRELLQRRQRRRPEGRGDLSFRRAGREREGLRPGEAPASRRDRGAARAAHRREDDHPVQPAPRADAPRHRDDDHRARRARRRRSSRFTPPGAPPTRASRSCRSSRPARRPTPRYTVGTNRIDISAVHDPRTGNFILTSAEDNLVKGASGQAVQIMNLWCGFDETAGLV